MAYDIATVRRVNIGRVGENKVTNIVFDVSAWNEIITDAAYNVHYIRPTEGTMYQPSITYDSEAKTLTWAVSNSDTAIEGIGLLEVTACTNDDDLTEQDKQKKRTRVIQAVIEPGLTWTGEGTPTAPDPLKDWANRLSALESKVTQTMNNCETRAETIVALANDMIESETLHVEEDEQGYVQLMGLRGREEVTMPIGSYYLTQADVDPGSIFGGTWERVGYDDNNSSGTSYMLMNESADYTVGNSYGQDAVMLNRNNLPEEL